MWLSSLVVGEFTHLTPDQLEQVTVAGDVLLSDVHKPNSKEEEAAAGLKRTVSIFKSVGTSIQDIVTAGAVYEAAEKKS